MAMDWLLVAILGFAYAILGYAVLKIYRKINVFLDSPAEALNFSDITSSFNEWINDDVNRESLQKNVENLVADPIASHIWNHINGAIGGRAKGINASMKALSKEVTSDAVDMVMPGMGSVATKYLEKYPELKAFLPMILGKAGNTGGIGTPNLTSITGGFNLPSGGPSNDPKRWGYNL